MRRFRSNNAKRIMAGILGFMVLFVLMFSALYIAVELRHDCCGEHCPVCTTLHQCETVLKIFHTAKVKAVQCVVPLLILAIVIAFISLYSYSETPVSQKVRLNN